MNVVFCWSYFLEKYKGICITQWGSWAGGVIQGVERLPSKHETLISNPSITKTNQTNTVRLPKYPLSPFLFSTSLWSTLSSIIFSASLLLGQSEADLSYTRGPQWDCLFPRHTGDSLHTPLSLSTQWANLKSTGAWSQALHLEPLHQPFCVWDVFFLFFKLII
jgi:hypothetical protein